MITADSIESLQQEIAEYIQKEKHWQEAEVRLKLSLALTLDQKLRIKPIADSLKPSASADNSSKSPLLARVWKPVSIYLTC